MHAHQSNPGKDSLDSPTISNTFIRAVTSLLSGSVIAQLLPYLGMMLLARLYSPAEFGYFAMFTAVSTIFAVVATGRYELAIVLPKQTRNAMAIVWLGITVAFIASFLLFAIGFLVSVTPWFSQNSEKYWLVLPIAVFFMAIYQILTQWFLRCGRYHSISGGRFIQAFITIVCSISLAFYGNKHGLIKGYIAGWIAGVLFFLFLVGKRYTKPSIQVMKKNAIAFKDHPLYGILPALFDSFAIFILVYIINHHYGSEMAGQYNISKQFAYSPVSLIVAAVGQVIFRESAQLLMHRQSVKPLFSILTWHFLWIAGLYVLFLMSAATWLFPFILGSSWKLAGQLTVILALGYGIRLIVTTMSTFLLAHNALKMNGAWQMLYFMVILSLYFFHPSNPIHFFMLLTMIDMVLFALYFTIIRMVIYRGDKTRCVV